MAGGIILSLKLGKTYRRTINFTFHSDSDASPLFYVQIATNFNSITMLNLHANSSLVHESDSGH